MEQQHLVVTMMTTAAAKTTVIQRSSGPEGNFDNKWILMSEVTKLFALKTKWKTSIRGSMGLECSGDEFCCLAHVIYWALLFIIFWFKNFRLFGGLRADIRRKSKFYISDFKDCLHVQCIASVFFMYFACLTPIITFGGLLGAATDNNMVRPLILLEILRHNLLKFLVSVFLFNLNVVQRIYKTTRKEPTLLISMFTQLNCFCRLQ